MKYKTMWFRTNKTDDGWVLQLASVNTNGPMPASSPNPTTGTFSYGEGVSDSEAFALLKASMIKAHQEEVIKIAKSIDGLQSSLKLLLNFDFEDASKPKEEPVAEAPVATEDAPKEAETEEKPE